MLIHHQKTFPGSHHVSLLFRPVDWLEYLCSNKARPKGVRWWESKASAARNESSIKGQTFEFHFDFSLYIPRDSSGMEFIELQGSLYYQTKQCMIITKHCHTLKHFSIKFDPSKISPLWRSIIDPASLPTGTLIGYSVEWHVEGWSVCAQLNTCVFRLLKSSKCNC